MDIEAAGIGRIEQRGMIAKPEAAALLATGRRLVLQLRLVSITLVPGTKAEAEGSRECSASSPGRMSRASSTVSAIAASRIAASAR